MFFFFSRHRKKSLRGHRAFLCPCVGPFPLLGLALRRDNLGISKHCNLPLNYLDPSTFVGLYDLRVSFILLIRLGY